MGKQNWTETLDTEDLAFIKRFVLASGSIKKVAAEYGISYPTVRLRLDKLILKIEIAQQYAESSEFEKKLRALTAGGKLSGDEMKALLSLHEEEIKMKSSK